MPNKSRKITYCMSWVHKFDFTVDEEKGRLNPSRDKILRQAPQKERWPSSCVTPARAYTYYIERFSLTSRIDGITTNIHTHIITYPTKKMPSSELGIYVRVSKQPSG